MTVSIMGTDSGRWHIYDLPADRFISAHDTLQEAETARAAYLARPLFDTSRLNPLDAGRAEKHLNRLCRYEGEIMTEREAYTRLAPVTRDRYRIHRDPAKPKAYGLTNASGTSLDCPALVWRACTLPIGRE